MADESDPWRSAAEQAALRRVATLVARGPAHEELFEAVVTEVGSLVAAEAVLVQEHGDDTVTVIGRWAGSTGYRRIGVRRPSGSGTLARLTEQIRQPGEITDHRDPAGAPDDLVLGWGPRSSAGAPVIVNGQAWGVIAVGVTDGGTLPPGTQRQLVPFAELLAIAIANAQGREQLERVAEALRRVARLAARDASPELVLEAVVTEAAGLVGVSFTTLLRFGPDGATDVVAVHHPPDGFVVGMSAHGGGDGATQQVWRTGRAARVDHLTDMSGGWARVAAVYRASAAAPVMAEDRLWGVLVAAGRRALPPQTEETLSRFAEVAGTAITSSQARAEVQALADEQAALLRVAEQVARGGPSDAVFAAVAAEAQKLLDGRPMTLARFEEGEAMTVISRRDGPAPPGTRIAYAPATLPDRVRRTARAVRVDDFSVEPNAAFARQHDLAAGVAAPIIVDGHVWGMLAATSADRPLARGSENRLQRIANLVGTAVGNATGRAQLVASRARVLATADETRRRLQRDVHDGAQQRLVHTLITLKLARQSLVQGDVPAGLHYVEDALKHAQRATDELREIVSGILPAALARGGLRGGLESLLDDLALPVDIAVEVPRLSVDVETTAYFIVAEALTNVVKHSKAGRAWVRAGLDAGAIRIVVGDDGVGGARAGAGSGLTGLSDRVEARGGQLRISSPPGQGTTVEATLPIGDPPASTA
ncbi:GAF domain-containing sensor histidine kinase [Actinoplanes sp. URMC 104]|uniref:GAF domain-containing sensor histidine kinase n=1 Tax=Actinoplanes sp. URMC 104 TaxID=3423409 RepID=UPI003F1D6BF6